MAPRPAPRPAPQRPVVHRKFDHARIWRLTQPVFERAALLIADDAPASDVVVGVARGGVPLADLVAAHLLLPTVRLAARHNTSDDIYLPATGDVRISEMDVAALASHLEGRRVLVADDICGTGATLKAVIGRLAAAAPTAVHSVVLCRSEAADFTPDRWVWDIRDWVVFPWNHAVPDPTEDLTLPAQVRGGPPVGCYPGEA